MTSSKFTCRSCGSSRLRLFLDLGDQPHCNRLIPADMADQAEPVFALRTYFCDDCTLVQIDHTIPKESMFSNYPYVSGTTTTLVRHFAETARRLVETYALRPEHLVVDIGSNDGTWLKQYEPFGLRVLGVDPAENVVAIALNNGVPTWARFFNEETARDIVAANGRASLVTAAGVFFHLEELHSVIRGVDALLAPDGVFVIQAIYLGGMVENVAFDQIYHEHLVYYTLRSLEGLLSPHGFEVFDAQLVPIHGGTIEVHVARRSSRAVCERVVAMRLDEERRGYGRFSTYEAFSDKVWALRDSLLALLKRYREEGKSVYAFGAPAKGATLLNSFGIGPDLVQRATERNPLKVGSYIPGARIPIVSEEGERPDAFLVLAWNFIDEFVARERAYLEGGGAFIVPVPALRVIDRGAIA